MNETAEPDKSNGLVISSISARSKASKKVVSSQDVSQSVNKIPKLGVERLDDSQPAYTVSISPASVKVSKKLPQGRPKTANYKPKTAISSWSKKSRSNMVAKFLSLDYSELFDNPDARPVMITLTYPDEWEKVVPDGPSAKRHLYLFRQRYERHYETKLKATWKMEFQSRQAVHFHLFTSFAGNITELRQWILETWADIVDHPNPVHKAKHQLAGTSVDEGMDFLIREPSLIAVYFSKHASPNGGVKEYQNRPPALWVDSDQDASIGRFWGVWNLKSAVFDAAVTYADALKVARTMRRWQRANSKSRKVRVWRTNTKTGETKQRWVTRKPKRMRGTSGYVNVPNGADMAEDLARLIKQQVDERANRVSQISLSEKLIKIGKFSVLSFDKSLSNLSPVGGTNELSLEVINLPCKFMNSFHGTSCRNSFAILWQVSKHRGIRLQPSHVNQGRTRNSPHTSRNVRTPFIKFFLVWLITKFSSSEPRKPHSLRHRIKRLFYE